MDAVSDSPPSEWEDEQHAEFQEAFEAYLKKSEEMFSSKGLATTSGHLWERALLAIGNYTIDIGSENRSLLINATSDQGSWKRLLRAFSAPEKASRKHVGTLLCRLTSERPYEEQLEEIIGSADSGIEPWRSAVVGCPAVFEYGQRRIIRFSEGNLYLPKKTQMNGAHVELFSYCFYRNRLPMLEADGELEPMSIGNYEPAIGRDLEPLFVLNYRSGKKTCRLDVDVMDKSCRIACLKSTLDKVPELKEALERIGVLEKLSDYLGVPKPYAGYWAKLANGKKPMRTPLPGNGDPELQSLTFYQHPDYDATVNEPPRELQFDDDIQVMLKRARELGQVRVPESLRNPHRLITLTKEDDERRAREEKIPWSQRDPSSRDRRPKRLSFEVTGRLQARAYRLFDALIKRIEAVSGEVRIVMPESRYGLCSTEVIFGGERSSTIRLREKCNQVRITNPKATYDWDRHRTELVPSGLLLLDRGVSDYLGPLAMDGKVKKLEDKLEKLIIDFVREAGETRLRRRREQEWARIKAEQEQISREREAELKRRKEALEKLKSEEAAKVTQLFEHAQGWQRSQLLREYLDALCFCRVGKYGVVDMDSELAKYLRWGFEQADRCDPLRPTPPSVLDEEVDVSDLDSDGDFRPRKPR